MAAAAAPGMVADEIDVIDIKAKQIAYHDWEARNYDGKWGISFDERCVEYARQRMCKAVPPGSVFDHVLEVGTGTGFFLLNLWQAGYVREDLHATDISPGMLEVCAHNAAALGVDVTTTPGDIEDLPYPDDRFDLVLGHAFLHHLPDPDRALAEMLRVLRPGGTLVIAGEPTRWGDRLAGVVKRTAYRATRAVTALPGAHAWRKPADGPRGAEDAAAALEAEVDLWTFAPREVEARARAAGFVDVRTVTEELVSGWLGWAARTIEGSLRPGLLGYRWAMSCYRGYLALNVVDEKLLSRVLPKSVFYNLILSARKPPRA